MVVFSEGRVLAIAAAVWAVWRVVRWRHHGGDPIREAVIAALFAWSAAVVRLTFFPMYLIFYDWRPRFSLVPFASIVQLATETSAAVAVRNLLGNVVLFVPFGILLPLLFRRLHRPQAALWRFAALSLTIELAQLVTRARSVDVDDVILNTVGAMLGWSAWRVGQVLAARWPAARTLLDRLAVATDREPMLTGAIPVVATVLLTVPFMIGTVVDATLGEQAAARDAARGWPGGEVAARADIGGDTLLLAVDGPRHVMRLQGYNRVLPGRYSLESWSDDVPAVDSSYRYGITTYNLAKGEQPTLYLWGVNRAGATSVDVSGNGVAVTWPLPDTPHFVVGAMFDPTGGDGAADALEPWSVRFRDGDGRDVTAHLPLADG